MQYRFLYFALLLVVAQPAIAQRVLSGFLTGNSYRELSESEKSGYAMGFINGLLAAPMMTGKDLGAVWLYPCTTKMTNSQAVVIIEKFLNDNPGRWQQPMNVLSFQALSQACPR